MVANPGQEPDSANRPAPPVICFRAGRRSYTFEPLADITLPELFRILKAVMFLVSSIKMPPVLVLNAFAGLPEQVLRHFRVEEAPRIVQASQLPPLTGRNGGTKHPHR